MMFVVIWHYRQLNSQKYLKIFNSEGDPDTEDIHENVRDMTASDITILKTSEEINQHS